MVKRQRIRKYLDKQLKGIQNNLNFMQEDIAVDTLHDLRLHTKKVKAVTDFLKESLHQTKKFSIKELKGLFHNSGDIRTAQLNLKTLNQLNIKSATFISAQQEVIKNDSKALINKKTKYIRHISSIRKNLEGSLTDIKNNIVISFYYGHIKALSNSFKIIDEQTLHDSRKVIKKLLYNLKILPPELTHTMGINKGYLDAVQDLIGQWHDTDVTLTLLAKGGVAEDESFDSLLKKKQEQLITLIKETRGFDDNVMFVKHTRQVSYKHYRKPFSTGAF